MRELDEYINHIKNKKSLSQNTISSYFTDIKKYEIYLNKNNISLKEITENDIISYLIDLEKSNISAASISRNISSIKSFHEFLFFSKACNNNPAANIKKPKIDRQDVDILTENEIDSLLNSPNLNTTIGIRDKAIFEVLYGTGIKVSELVALNINDVNIEVDYIHCISKKAERTIPLSQITKKYLINYINESRNTLIKDSQEEALFVNSNGSRFTRQGLWKVIKKYSDIVNINKNINPTILRHSFAIHLLNKGANVSVVNKILGNTNLASLQLYLNYMDKNIRKEINEKHPRK